MKKVYFVLIFAGVKVKQIFSVVRAILQNKISFYPDFVLDFEKKYASFCSKKYALSFCNGTSAIDASLFALGIQSGDEVIVPSCTFHASIDPICNVGAQPVFVDVDRRNLTICPKDLRKKITPKTKAIMVVHLFGIPADMKSIQEIAENAGVEIIEDVSHAHGAIANGKSCGSWGRAGAFSLQGAKAIAAGEGGVVVTDNRKDYLKMSLWGHFNRHGSEFAEIQCEDYKHTGLGYKRRMAPLSSLLASADLSAIDQMNRIMTKTAESLDQALRDIPGVFVPIITESSRRGGFYCGYPLSVSGGQGSRASVVEALKGVGIKTSGYPFESHHEMKIYRDLSYRERVLQGGPTSQIGDEKLDLVNTMALQESLILIPRRNLVTLSQRKINRVAEVISEVLRGNDGA